MREGDNRLWPEPSQDCWSQSRIIGRLCVFQRNETDFVWDEEKLDRFIANPDEVVAGNNMKPYGGLASSEDRKKIVTFLAQQK